MIERGTGESTIVLVHGYCCAPSDWDWHIDAFAREHRVIAPALLCHGTNTDTRSDDLSIGAHADAIAADLIAKDAKNAVLCGHSLGSRVVLEVNARIPDRVRGCVLIDGSHVGTGDLATLLADFDTTTEGELVKPWAQSLFDQMFLAGDFPQIRETYRARISNMSGDVMRAVYRYMILWDAAHFADRIRLGATKPMLVMQSTVRGNDGIRRRLVGKEIGPYPTLVQSLNPSAEVRTYPDCGHFIQLDAPEQLRDDIESWISAL